MADNDRKLAFSRGKRNLRISLDGVQRELDEGPLTEDAIRTQLELLDEVRGKSRDLEIEMLIALEEDELDALEREFDWIFLRYCELKAALLALVTPDSGLGRGPEGREEQPKHVVATCVEIPELESTKTDENLLEMEGRTLHDRLVGDDCGQHNIECMEMCMGETGNVRQGTSTLNESYYELGPVVAERRRASAVITKVHLESLTLTGISSAVVGLYRLCITKKWMKYCKFVHIAFDTASTWVDAGGGPG